MLPFLGASLESTQILRGCFKFVSVTLFHCKKIAVLYESFGSYEPSRLRYRRGLHALKV